MRFIVELPGDKKGGNAVNNNLGLVEKQKTIQKQPFLLQQNEAQYISHDARNYQQCNRFSHIT